MKSRTLTFITAWSLFAALAVPVRLAAQEKQPAQQQNKSVPRYVLIDVGTLAGPNSYVNGPGVSDLSSQGTYVGEAETSIPDLFAPDCLDPECLVQHTQRWRDGVVTDLGALSGPNNNSGSTWISADGRFISGFSENGVVDPLLGTPESRAIVWNADQIVDLGTLEGGNESFATGVTSRGLVIGISSNTIPDPFS